MPKYADLKGKTVIVRLTHGTYKAEIVDVEDAGIWIKAKILDPTSPTWPTHWPQDLQELASKITDQVIFVPIQQVEWIAMS